MTSDDPLFIPDPSAGAGGGIASSIPFEKLPPLVQEAVRRCAFLQRKIEMQDAMLRERNENAEAGVRLQTTIKSHESEIAELRASIEPLKAENLDLKAKLENFRGMIKRRDERIAKLEAKKKG